MEARFLAPLNLMQKRGATVICARDFLVANNVNLNTPSTIGTNAIAFDIREAGRTFVENGVKINKAGSLKSVEAIKPC